MFSFGDHHRLQLAPTQGKLNKMKYELTEETKEVRGITVHRIKALKDFGDVKAGDFGGWIEAERNLSQHSECWVSGNAKVSGYAMVSGDAIVSGNAKVSGYAMVSGDAMVYGNAKVSGDAQVSGDARVFGNARVYGDARVFGNAWVSGNAIVFGDAMVSGNAMVYGY